MSFTLPVILILKYHMKHLQGLLERANVPTGKLELHESK